ncbi:hypothetical protein [Novosphingobium sp.]|uniref:hypothetical protein n=1 Tax=Novosphingobium sp. TaxID=1874826 RepID=UPI0025F85940|nr:hypothetical protein [Novosphingobium sp.]
MFTATFAAQAQAQSVDPVDARVAEVLDNAHRALSPVAPRQSCAGSSDDEIVVCAATDSSRYRVPSTIDSNPGSRAALRNGVPTPPQLDRGSCRGQPGCMIGGYAPPKVYVIDLKAIPEAPAGSDADRIGKGEIAAP